MIQKFEFKELEMKGAYEITPFYATDERGGFVKDYNIDMFKVNGIEHELKEVFYTLSKRGVIRATHFQLIKQQAKLVRCVSGHVYDVIVDLRPDSPTYGQWEGIYLSAENKRQFYVPEGFAHGFVVLSETATFNYKCTDFYSPEHDGGVLWNDEDIAIEWPLDGIEEVLLSEKDKKQKTFKELDLPFVYK